MQLALPLQPLKIGLTMKTIINLKHAISSVQISSCSDTCNINRHPRNAQELLRTPRSLGRGRNVTAVEAHLEGGSSRLLRVFHRRLVIGVAPASKILSGRTLPFQRLDRVRAFFFPRFQTLAPTVSHTHTHIRVQLSVPGLCGISPART